ncbi:CMD domain protein [Variovorax sp. LjRoot175]
MSSSTSYNPAEDLVDRIVGLDAAVQGSATHALRHQRDKVAAATQGSYDALFDPALPGLSLRERLLVALYACRLTPAPELAAHYRERLQAEGTQAGLIEAVAGGTAQGAGDARLQALLTFTRTLIERPVEGDRVAVQALPAAGVATPAVVALSQLIAFLSYQTRLAAGLKAMKSLEAGA